MPKGHPIQFDPAKLEAVQNAQLALEEAERVRNKALVDALGFVGQDDLANAIGGVSISTLWRRINEGKALE